MAAFSTDGAATIQRKTEAVKVGNKSASAPDLEEVYETDKCVKWIQDNNFQRVALQFPDDLLPDSASVLHNLQMRTSTEMCILADTSYGSCCVDEVAAEHYLADCIIHYGHSCLSPTQRLPVLYVLGREPLDVQHCQQTLMQLVTDLDTKLLVLADVVYHHAMDELEKELGHHYPNVVISRLVIPEDLTTTTEMSPPADAGPMPAMDVLKFGRCLKLSDKHTVEDYTMFYIGREGATLTNFMMTFNQCQFYSYDPLTREGRKESVSVNKLLMKRYYLIERAKDANIIGILVGTLGVSDYLSCIERLKSAIKKAGKKSYTFVVGKLNVAKLANFAEVDIYVLVACPENTLLDSSEFYRPVVTPFEMEMACNPSREWTGQFVADFRELLPGGRSHVQLPEGDQDIVRDVSLITGGVRSIGVDKDAPEVTECTQAVVKRDDMMTVANIQAHSAGEYLSERSWQGLDPQLGKTEVSTAMEGSKGIAASYKHEPT